eukprot:NODE_368_length_8682_cov_0.309915.p1 type:complete len:428 gc:universal NODE_368_length_8682_cov_0.309915:1337-2620(+)
MYALLLRFLIAVSIDCPVVIQLALDLDIKYTNTAYYAQYEQDCCLGYGVICENERVVELRWGFTKKYNQVTYPVIQLPPQLRVLDLSYSTKYKIIRKLPDTLKVLILDNVNDIKLEINAFPNLTYFQITFAQLSLLPPLPNSLEVLDIYSCFDFVLPKNTANLKEFYNAYGDFGYPRQFPNLPDTIEALDVSNSNLFGPISIDFKSIRSLTLNNNLLSGNLTITSPNITQLVINSNKFDRMLVTHFDKINFCETTENYFEPDNQVLLSNLKPYGCAVNIKSISSPDCPNLLKFLKQLNLDLANPNYYKFISGLQNCCEDIIGYVICVGNRVDTIKLTKIGNLNGTVNGTLLPDTLTALYLDQNDLQGMFPNLSRLNILQALLLNENNLTGPIYGKLPNSLITLGLARNNLNGTIPNLSNKRMGILLY